MSQWTVTLIVMLATQTTCRVQSMSLRPVISANGSPFCGLSNPSILIAGIISIEDIIGIEMGVPEVTRCAYQCVGMNSSIGCVGFNYIRFLPSSGQCEFFRRSPLNCTKNFIVGCTYYEVFGSGQSSSSACSPAQTFVAQNATVNVSIPTIGNVPLRSFNGWLTILSRVDSNFPTDLSWTSYKVGFGNIMSNFWLGLESIFQLTNINAIGRPLYRLRFEVQSTVTQRWYWEEYDWFYLDSETQFYALHVSLTATGDAGDSINSVFQPGASSNGMPFSSKDADNDMSPSMNCAATYLGGWWYRSCSSSKQLGSLSSNFMWNSLVKATPPVINSTNPGLIASRMMIRPIN